MAGLSVLLYVTLPIWPIAKGRFILAGALMLFAAFLPLLWQFNFTDSDAYGFGLLFVVLAPIPLFVIAATLIRRVGNFIWARVSRQRAS
jgi:hypothetical protein